MQVVPFGPEHTSTLYEVYREVTADAAHCRLYPSAAQFGHALAHPGREGTRVLVVEDGGRAVGFAALLDGGVGEDGMPEAQITALFARPEEPGQALVDA